MYESTQISLRGYMPVGDIIVIALCMTMAVLLWHTQINRNTKFRSIMLILITTWFATSSNIIYEMLMYSENVRPALIYIMRTVHHVTLTFIPCMYIQYLRSPLWIPDDTKKQYGLMFGVAISVVTIFDVMGMIFKFNFYIDSENVIHRHFNPYNILYILLMSSIFYMIIKSKARVIRQIYYALLGVNAISVLIMVIQEFFGQISFTCISYFFPIIGIVFMFYSNPYDIKTGAVSGCFLINELTDAIEKKNQTVLLSITMMDFSKAVNQSHALKHEFYGFCRRNIKKGILYHFPNERIVLTIPKKSNGDYLRLIDTITNNFRRNIYEKFNIDYKITVMETSDDIKNADDYMKIVDYVETNMNINEFHTVTEKDIKNYYNSNYILSQLEDIVMKKDLNDERILVYCQPVFNLLTNSYDTAEALMRLKLEKTGLVFPDQFIPLAEQHNMIHTLSMIILNKTCHALHEIISENYEINRISVNFSALDIKYETFCQEIRDIIEQNDIPYDKIAVEITESRCEADFNLMREKVTQLQELGIKFYLDDFGTGYSNFERIMEIPFNIIKFDRSMLIESVKNDSSKFMVSTFANMFSKLNYAVLFEGVENDYDENHCVNMNANYLQGYKYSKPIPIEQLKNFLQRSPV